MKISDIQKLKGGSSSFCTVTAYDYPTAKIIDDINIPLVLVGDSASMVVYGYNDTTQITMDEMILIAKAVRRGIKKSFLVGDMPFMSYQPSVEDAIKNAGRFIKESQMDAIKLEGGIEYLPQIKSIIQAGIPVMGHIGLKPQSILTDSGYKIHGKKFDDALKIYEDALALERAGIFALVLEGVPEELAKLITESLQIPTIGIGAGRYCDGQIQVLHDLIGLFGTQVPKHAKSYVDLKNIISKSLSTYQEEVLQQQMPSNAQIYNMNETELEQLKKAIENL
ncbi:MAG: 3-methyl-2-oxobutanoate hydroxymethyltransferase [Candidatus Marinimicrobia bacterium]|mgnify:FL=1|nr:3-methyl-2-oxobutanoate hydroxymethyltransferase [Candidatus Neomarinimicrobiota bacterium]